MTTVKANRQEIAENHAEHAKPVTQYLAEISPLRHRVLLAIPGALRRLEQEAEQSKQTKSEEQNADHREAPAEELRQGAWIPEGASENVSEIQSSGRGGAAVRGGLFFGHVVLPDNP